MQGSPVEDRGAMNLKKISYRRAIRASDRDAVRELVQSTGFFTQTEVDIAVELVDENLARGERSGYGFLFAEMGGEILGYACFGPIAGTAGSYDLYWIATHQPYQRLGIGRLILGRSEALMVKE